MQRLQAEGRWGVWEEDREGVFCVQKKLRRVVPLLKAILNVPDEGHRDSFFKLVQRCVEVQDFHDLLCGEGGAQRADGLSIL